MKDEVKTCHWLFRRPFPSFNDEEVKRFLEETVSDKRRTEQDNAELDQVPSELYFGKYSLFLAGA